jgi:hypothetical protein
VAARLNLASVFPVTSILFFFALIAVPAILISCSVLAGRAIAGITAPARELIRRFSLALVPLAAGMWAAHYSFHFLTGWKSAWPFFHRLYDGLGLTLANQGSLGFGMEFGMTNVRTLQILLLDIGLLATLYLGWRVARIYAPKLHLAFRAVAPWSVVAVGLYVFGVWTCLQPMQMRGLSNALF